MAGLGPLPKRQNRRRGNDTLASPLVRLPACGREGEPPLWPLTGQTAAERAVWAELWVTPQSVAWEELGWTRAVARYARVLVVAERPKAPASVLAEVRQIEDRLGLTPMAMLRLRWSIDDEAPTVLHVVPDRWRDAARSPGDGA